MLFLTASDNNWTRYRGTGQCPLNILNLLLKFIRYNMGKLIIKTSWKGIGNMATSDIRAKLPTGRGMWPAIWMLGTNIDQFGRPVCGEIDIMEYAG